MDKLYSQKRILQSALRAKEKERFKLAEKLAIGAKDFGELSFKHNAVNITGEKLIKRCKLTAVLDAFTVFTVFSALKVHDTLKANISAITAKETGYLTEVTNTIKSTFGVEIAPNSETFYSSLKTAAETNPALMEFFQENIFNIMLTLEKASLEYITPDTFLTGAGIGAMWGIIYYALKSTKLKNQTKQNLEKVEEQQQIILDEFNSTKAKFGKVQEQINKINKEIGQISQQQQI